MTLTQANRSAVNFLLPVTLKNPQLTTQTPVAGANLIMVTNCTEYKFESTWTKQYGEIYFYINGVKSFCIAGPTTVPLEDDAVS